MQGIQIDPFLEFWRQIVGKVFGYDFPVTPGFSKEFVMWIDDVAHAALKDPLLVLCVNWNDITVFGLTYIALLHLAM